jgi:hypothetical protein
MYLAESQAVRVLRCWFASSIMNRTPPRFGVHWFDESHFAREYANHANQQKGMNWRPFA